MDFQRPQGKKPVNSFAPPYLPHFKSNRAENVFGRTSTDFVGVFFFSLKNSKYFRQEKQNTADNGKSIRFLHPKNFAKPTDFDG